MLKSLILFILVLNIAFAKDRFSEADIKRFLDEVKQEVAEHKVENNGRVDLQIIKPGFYAELEEYLKQEKFTREEMLKIKQDYENLAKDSSITSDKAEAAFYAFIEKELSEINAKALPMVTEGNICNNWSCADGLKCAPDPVQEAIGKLKKAGASCLENSECVSNDCVEATPGSKNKICEDVFRCFRPLSLGESCMSNPVCGLGACLPYNSMTSGIGECTVQGNACKKNSDCCSNSCNSGICKENYICKDCVGKGKKALRGQKCCEGLYQNGSGMCVPDVPPSVFPEVYVSPVKKMFVAMAEMIFSSAHAEDAATTATTAASTTEEVADTFITTGATNDGHTLKSGVMSDKEKYKSFKGETEKKESDNLTLANIKTNLTFEKRSNFETCDIYFKEDFYNDLKKTNAFDNEVAFLAFDFVSTGKSDSDYWTVSGKQGSSIYDRINQIGLEHKAVRAETNKKIAVANKQLTCTCLDVQGLDKITDSAKKKFFMEQCDEYEKYTNPNTNLDELSGDASGLKAKRLLVAWTSNMKNFTMTLSTDNLVAANQLNDLANWVQNDAKMAYATTETFDLFKFNIKNPSGSVAGLGALVGALLAAGVIAILGGFATTSILSTWAAAGIITASAATGAGGLWMIASLKGAWITQKPEITDSHVAPRSYSCGKKQTCMEYTRTLVQPFNNICNIHTSSNACLKSFVVVNENGESRYIVDPWIPAGVSKSAILKDQPNYAEKMEEGFKAAKAAMISKNPGATGGGGKKGGGSFVAESYLSEVFIDSAILGKYLPGIGQNLESIYYLDADRIKIIKEAAKNFAIAEGVLEASQTENLNSFANYAYEYHFLWPKKSSPKEIGYPTVGLQKYLDYMAVDVGGSSGATLASATSKLNKVNIQYLTDLLNTLKLYASNPINQTDAIKTLALNAEITDVQKQLDSALTLQTLLDNKNLDTQLSSLSSGFIASQSKTSGASGTANFSTDETNFLKAVGNTRTARKAQLKALDTYNKAMASSGDKERTTKMASLSKSFSNKFSNRNGSVMSSSGLGSSSSSGSSASSLSAIGSRSGSTSATSNAGTINGTGALYGSGSGSRSGSGASSSSGGTDANAANAAAATTAVNEDEARLADAIDARNKAKKDKYQSNDGQSLFEKVTNAYIRNYDKVLTKKKDKDVVEEKQ